MSEGFGEVRLLGKICGEILGWVKVGGLGVIFGGHHKITCFRRCEVRVRASEAVCSSKPQILKLLACRNEFWRNFEFVKML